MNLGFSGTEFSTRVGTIVAMATNLRLRPDAEAALRAEAERSGISQQEIIRRAVDQYLALAPSAASATELDVLVATAGVRPPRAAYRAPDVRLTPPAGTSSADLLDRSDRL